MESAEALKLLDELIADIAAVRRDGTKFSAWQRKCTAILDSIFGRKSSQLSHLQAIRYYFRGAKSFGDDVPYRRAFEDGLTTAAEVLRQFKWEIETLGIPADSQSLNVTGAVDEICQRFHHVCRQLRRRHAGRPTLDVSDEYDVQDLLHALLRIYFDDVREEEWTPSYAGGCGRMDFLLKNEQVVIECKMTRAGLTAKKLGEELMIDVGRYEHHGSCKLLICFVYDPDGRIANPAGIENDLSRKSETFSVKVIITPKN